MEKAMESSLIIRERAAKRSVEGREVHGRVCKGRRRIRHEGISGGIVVTDPSKEGVTRRKR